MDFLGISLIIEPTWLISGIPGALGQSVPSLFFSETSQDLGGLGSDPPLTGSLNKCFF